MRLDGYAEATTPSGETLRYENEGLAVWVGSPDDKSIDVGGKAWFDHFDGRISVKNPTTETLQKMHAIASSLGAKVQGDEGEFYNQNGQVLDA